MGKFIDLTGQRFGRLTVLDYLSGHRSDPGKWRCRCVCGTIVEIATYDLKRGHAKSCGCLQRELAKERHLLHGKTNTRLYYIWSSARQRTQNQNNQKYEDYGGRGIYMCEEWNDFSAFEKWALANGYSDWLTLDRIDVNGPYSPKNCRWANAKEQQRNRRNNVLLSLDNNIQCMSAWAEETGISTKVIHWRLSHGWTVEDALTTPVKQRRKSK